MRIKLLVCLLVLLFTLPLTAAPPKGKISKMATNIDNTTWIDANRILMFVTNHGNFGRDLSDYFGYDYGTFFPYAGDPQPITDGEANAITSPLYAGGLWAGGIDSATGEIRVIVAEFNDEYVPGPMLNGTFQEDRPEFRVYKLFRDSLAANPNQDYLDYLTYAVAQGAPVDSMGLPDMVGDQMLWSVFNDADPDQHTNGSGETLPLGLEVKMTTFAFDRQGSLGNIVVVRLRVFNKGVNTITDCYFSCWADPDLGGSGDDLVGCDTLLGLGYVYNDNDEDQFYADRPPCLGYDFFQGPLRAKTAADTLPDGTPVPDSGRMWGQMYADSLNRGMASFNKYINGTDPDGKEETYRYMNGLNRDGTPLINDATGEVTTYQMSGDPVAGTGWIDTAPDDRRFMQSTGPVTFRPGDSTEIIIGIVVGQGSDRLNSITVMKGLDAFAQRLYESGFNPPNPPASPVVNVAELPGEIILTWGDTSEVDPGDYEFEGYTVWQGESASGPWTEIATFDSINGRSIALIDSLTDPSTNLILPDIKRVLSDNGLAYGFGTTADAINGGPLRDVSEYFFRVTAFSFSYIFNDEGVPNGDRFLESQTVLRVNPQSPPAGTDFGDEANDTLAVTHTTGGSGGVIYPIITDPFEVTGDDYRINFSLDTVTTPPWIEYDTTVYDTTIILADTCDVDWDVDGDTIIVTYCTQTIIDSTIVDTINHAAVDDISTYWTLTNVTTSTVLLDRQFNQTGDTEYKIVEGMMVKVVGPAFGVVGIDEIADASGPITADNVMWSLNSTRDWYVGSDHSSDFSRMNWRGLIGTYDFEMRFTAGGSEYYNFGIDSLYPANAPFEFWNIGIDTPDDPSDDVRVTFAVLDDDESGGWSYGDRLYPDETPYVEPLPIEASYGTWRIGRIVFNDYSEATTQPAEGTIIRFTTAKINTPVDVFDFSTSAATYTSTEADLEDVKAVPNPFYLFDNFDPSPGSKRIAFHHLPEICTIRIYNLGGDLVATVDKDETTPGAIAYWDVLSEQNLPVASGIYVYVVDAPGFGTKVGKMAVFTEAEVLKIY